ncbi:deoxyribonuclease TATDN1 [Anopheles gambiae]|uniref:Deoxyribonuclease TATDN1 n=1 Tax=Anopheles coluzzii TaxID=1518534 RepID=A0A6E8VP15_ANOCL|nr:deoxyribonuclease TATDN1 [Anopheles coluzzii]XP_316220.5 deoxyribonuclease TATDN1 [Anopheles gambiae]
MKRLLATNISKIMKFIDIGANLTDPMYQGIYNGSAKHEPDLPHVLERSWTGGLDKIIITVGTLADCAPTFEIVKNDERLYATVGCHPTRCGEFLPDPEGYFASLCQQIEQHREKVVAIGECGLDYDRLQFCDKAIQQQYFEKQLELAARYDLPLFLHCRNAHDDFAAILRRNRDKLPRRGVVHTFDGSLEVAEALIADGYAIGINGCSLKTEENLSVAAKIPDESIMLETDSPWCEIRPSHAGSKYVRSKYLTVKKKEKWEAGSLIAGRCEPVMISQVLEVLAGIKGKPAAELADQYYKNTAEMFFPSKGTD